MRLEPTFRYDAETTRFEARQACPSCRWEETLTVVLKGVDVLELQVVETPLPLGFAMVMTNEAGVAQAYLSHYCRGWPLVDEPLGTEEFSDWPEDEAGPRLCEPCLGSGLVWTEEDD